MAQAETQKKIYTIGHGNKAFDELADILKTYHIRTLADIRSYPGAKRNPHFNREALEASLPQVGVAYEWFKGLGGYRKNGLGPGSPHVVLRSQGFRNYADYMLTEAFKENIDKLHEIANALLEKETLDGKDIDNILGIDPDQEEGQEAAE